MRDVGMSISSVNEDLRGDCPVCRFKVEEFFPVEMGMEVKAPPRKEVWGWGWYFIIHLAETPSPKTSKITFINLYFSAL
jgi:hypothetical protein